MSFATVNGLTFYFRMAGTRAGRPLVFVNSLGTDGRIWDEVIPLLSGDGSVLTYDKRGHGLSDVPPGPYSIDDHVSDLVGLLDHCDMRRIDLCGVSIGGMIAMRVAAQHPDRVRRLVLCDTAPAIGTPVMWNERIATVSAEGMTAIAETIVSRWLAPDFRAQRPADCAGWRNLIERTPAAGYIATCATVRDCDLRADVARIVAPTLVVGGENDPTTPPALVRSLAAMIGGARLELVANAGHIPSIEQPAVLARLINEHLREAPLA